jgi:hypothetical protein
MKLCLTCSGTETRSIREDLDLSSFTRLGQRGKITGQSRECSDSEL